jgi:hypothetical protein
VNRSRIGRWTARLAITSVVALQAFAGSAGAAVPDAIASSEAIPASYSAGNAAGFRGTYHFTDASTLARLHLVIGTTGASGVAFRSATLNGSTVANACTSSLPVTCQFRQVRTGDTIVVTTAFTPAEGATSVSATYTWNTTGATPSDGGTSHGDTWDGITQTATLNTDPNYAGGFVNSGGGTIQNLQVVSESNKQATKLASLPAGVAATVLDGPGLTNLCTNTADVNCADQFGETSIVTVGDGQSFGAPFTISIVYYQGSPDGFVHRYGPDDSEQEFIGPCPKKNPASAAPCFTWTNKSRTATIYTFHNGSYRGLS